MFASVASRTPAIEDVTSIVIMLENTQLRTRLPSQSIRDGGVGALRSEQTGQTRWLQLFRTKMCSALPALLYDDVLMLRKQESRSH